MVHRPPGAAISLRGVCGWGKQIFLGGSDPNAWNSSKGPLPLLHPFPFIALWKAADHGVEGLDGGSEAVEPLTSGLTTGLRVVLSFLVLNAELPEAPKHLVGLP